MLYCTVHNIYCTSPDVLCFCLLPPQVFYGSIQAVLYVLCYHMVPFVSVATQGLPGRQGQGGSPGLGAASRAMGTSPATYQVGVGWGWGAGGQPRAWHSLTRYGHQPCHLPGVWGGGQVYVSFGGQWPGGGGGIGGGVEGGMEGGKGG